MLAPCSNNSITDSTALLAALERALTDQQEARVCTRE
jgi:hypothetical protein